MTKPSAIVIGSGFGGLAAAIRLSCKGYHVQVPLLLRLIY
jgi:phytoene desaturase